VDDSVRQRDIVPLIERGRGPGGWKAWRLTLVVAVIALMGGLGITHAQGQSEATSFEATAAAEGVRVGVAAPSFILVDQLVDVGVPVAQSTVDGLRNSTAFASNPYPGALVVEGPGLFAGFTGLPSPGSYPFYVSSSFPTATDSNFSQPNYNLSAKSAEQSSEAVASAGGSTAGSSLGAAAAKAASKRDAASGVVSAEAISTADVVNLSGGALRIGSVKATASVSRTPGGGPVRSSSLSVDGVSVAGQSVGFSDKGLVLAGSTTPIPQDNPLTAVLEQAKISVHYLQPITTPDGVVSAGVAITQQQQVPQGPSVIVTYTFGQAVAHASAVSGGLSAGGGPPAVGGEGAAPVSESALNGTGGAAGSGAGPALSTGTGAIAAGAGASNQSNPSRALDTIGGRVTRAGVSKGGPSTASIYLILAIGGLLAVAGAQLLRIMGVKMAWTS